MSLADLPGSGHVAQHLLHVGVLVPELVGTGQDGHRTVPDVASMVDLHTHAGSNTVHGSNLKLGVSSKHSMSHVQ